MFAQHFLYLTWYPTHTSVSQIARKQWINHTISLPRLTTHNKPYFMGTVTIQPILIGFSNNPTWWRYLVENCCESESHMTLIISILYNKQSIWVYTLMIKSINMNKIIFKTMNTPQFKTRNTHFVYVSEWHYGYGINYIKASNLVSSVIFWMTISLSS